MPLKIYCVCGEFTEYTLQKPSFCSACGTKFEGSISIASKKPIKQIIEDFNDLDDGESLPENIEEEQETPKLHKLYGQTSKKSNKNRKRREINDENIDIDDLNINALQLDIPISTKKEKGVTLGQVIKEQKTGFERAKPKRVNKKAELEKFRNEAGMGGRKDISIEDKGAE